MSDQAVQDRPDDEAEATSLKRAFALKDSVFLGVGGILGAGIYAIVGEAAGLAGGYLWLSLVVAAAVALLTALSYAELVSVYPDAGGGYEYVKQAFHRYFAVPVGLLLLLTGIISPAAIAIAFADYLGRVVDIPAWAASVSVIALVAIINAIGAANASWFNIAATVITVAGLLMVIAFGVPAFSWERVTAAGEASVWVGVSSGAALAFFSYVGFEDLVGTAEETQNPRRAVPKAMIISNAVVLVIYVLVAASAVCLVAPDKLARDSGPLAAVMRAGWGPIGATTITIIALFATSKTILTNMLGGSRLLMDMARDVWWLGVFKRVMPRVHTPVFAIGLMFAATAGFSLIGDLRLVATVSNFAIIGVYLAVNTALIKLRIDAHKHEPAFAARVSAKRWPILPVLAIAALIYLATFNVYNLL